MTPSAAEPPRRTAGAAPFALDAAALAALKLAVGAFVLRLGFSHVSDDDYARTVIAQHFARAPRWDPSATSWLPAPFWITGTVMSLAGRSLGVARAVALALGAASVAAPYGAMRAVGTSRRCAFAATAVAMLLPWNAWLGAATVPEAWTGALVAAAAIALAAPSARARTWAGAALSVAALSRYEAWPVCAVAGAICARRALRGGGRREVVNAVVAVAAPLVWMAWNAHAHGSATHFLARVSAFRQAAGAAALPLGDKLLGFPGALVEQTPEAAALGAVGIAGLAVGPSLRRRWAPAVCAAIAILVFLVAGDLRDGAPTHHAARALAPTWWILTGLGVETAVTAVTASRTPAQRTALALVLSATGAAWCASLPARWRTAPGQSEWDRRDAQIARGQAMRARGVAGADITPCAFEHFALLAAWGEPERATIRPASRRPPTTDCPVVEELLQSPDAVGAPSSRRGERP
ncbi:MAG TPA: hypothetical protein VKU41_25550 [Polyangiaceae bacterium]|nr:hypothetical protein [Polyangiaceae bacterium]